MHGFLNDKDMDYSEEVMTSSVLNRRQNLIKENMLYMKKWAQTYNFKCK